MSHYSGLCLFCLWFLTLRSCVLSGMSVMESVKECQLGTWAFLSFHSPFLFVFVHCEFVFLFQCDFQFIPDFQLTKRANHLLASQSQWLGLKLSITSGYMFHLVCLFFFKFWILMLSLWNVDYGVSKYRSVEWFGLFWWTSFHAPQLFLFSLNILFCLSHVSAMMLLHTVPNHFLVLSDSD
jgi:hypothetical protein